MTVFRAYAWYRVRMGIDRPYPPPAAVRLMVLEIERQMRAAAMQPVSVSCVSWSPSSLARLHGDDHLARVAITCEPGEPARPLTSWFQWQHPNWTWASSPAPTIEHIEGTRQLPFARDPRLTTEAGV
jgi:hypothetical protein